MTKPEVVVVRTGIANTASVLAGISRAGGIPRLTDNAAQVEQAELLVLPGVGAFGAGMEQLHRASLVSLLKQRLADQRPTLAVCLGLQLLFSSSAESPGIEGLGVIPAQITRFPGSLRVPQLGWNRVNPDDQCRLLTGGYAYFANSYRAERIPDGWAGAYAEYGGDFVAALEKGPILCCQFHPELSGKWGIRLLERWLKMAAGHSN